MEVNLQYEKVKTICVVIITQGGGVAAPIGSQIFSEVLPYLEVVKDGLTSEEIINQVEVPNIEGKTINEAKKILKECNLQLVINNEQEQIDKDNIIVKEQVPKARIMVKEGSSVYIDY